MRPGADGRPRCFWAVGPPEYGAYHDDEWGRPVLDDTLLFEHLSLEAFQAGLSWLTILRKRAAFRAAFADFDPAAVAAYSPGDVARLLDDAGIVRNRRKIEATIANAGRTLELVEREGSMAAFFWSFRPARHAAPRTATDLVATSPEATALAKELKHRGFRFVGPTTVYALMQSTGIVDDHLAGCCMREAVERERAAVLRRLASAGALRQVTPRAAPEDSPPPG
ncbi:MAG: DNA-3-methyladenine glycosylase I [Thermoleophilia bacterium]|nr:DNA-3-methyladenine glycosylase I [Thermoleophilia bacterium]